MSLVKYILSKCSCKSSCAFNENEIVFDTQIMNVRLSNYKLKLKDVKKINGILSKREKQDIESKIVEL